MRGSTPRVTIIGEITMRNPDRLDNFYEELKKIHKEKVPDWRAGQLFMNVLGQMSLEGRDPFFPEEDEIIEYFREYFEKAN